MYSNPKMVGKVVFYIADYLIIAVTVYLIYLYLPLGQAWWSFKANSVTTAVPNPTAEVKELAPVVTNKEFKIAIPRILASAKVVVNVDPFNSDNYLTVLKNGDVAQAKGSNLPGGGRGKTTYLFAHSTEQGLNMVRVNSVFYLLGELKNGDDMWVEYQGNRYLYKVYDKKVVKASEIQYLTYTDPGKEVLILQTCWPIGTDWNRLLVFGELVPVE